MLTKACVRYTFDLRRRDELSEHENIILGCGILRYVEFRAVFFLDKVDRTGTLGY